MSKVTGTNWIKLKPQVMLERCGSVVGLIGCYKNEYNTVYRHRGCMGLLDFLENKVSEFADRNTDDLLRCLGFDMSRLTRDSQDSIHRDCRNAQYAYAQAGNMVPFTVAERALVQLTFALIRANCVGNPEIANEALMVIPRLQTEFFTDIRQDIVLLISELINSAAEQHKANETINRRPAQTFNVKSEPVAEAQKLQERIIISRSSSWREFDRPAAARRRQ